MKNDEEYMKIPEMEGSPVGYEKDGMCPVSYELSKHPWLDESMAKRIVNENLADDPDFYDFLEMDEEEDEEEEEVMPKPGFPKKEKPMALEITIGTME